MHSFIHTYMILHRTKFMYLSIYIHTCTRILHILNIHILKHCYIHICIQPRQLLHPDAFAEVHCAEILTGWRLSSDHQSHQIRPMDG